jgi:hypothetical protein
MFLGDGDEHSIEATRTSSEHGMRTTSDLWGDEHVMMEDEQAMKRSEW